jgi:hypothetical protein
LVLPDSVVIIVNRPNSKLHRNDTPGPVTCVIAIYRQLTRQDDVTCRLLLF